MENVIYVFSLITALILGVELGRKIRFHRSYKKLRRITELSLESIIIVLVFFIGIGAGSGWTSGNLFLIFVALGLGIVVSLTSVFTGLLLERARGNR